MELSDIRIGMKCGSKKGNGTVTWIDGSTGTIYMADIRNNNNFQVSFRDIIAVPAKYVKKGTLARAFRLDR